MRRTLIGIGLLLASTVSFAQAVTQDARFLQFVDAAYFRTLNFSPSLATSQGESIGADRWEDLSERGLRAEAELARRELRTLATQLDRADLSPAMQMQHRVFAAQQELIIERYRWRNHLFPLNQIVGPHVDVPRILAAQPVSSIADAERYIRRIRAVGAHFDSLIARLDAQAKAGVYLPRSIYPILLGQARGVVAGQPHGANAVSPILTDFERKIASLELAPTVRKRLTTQATRALQGDLGPAYTRLIGKLEAHSVATPFDGGVWQLPEGAEFYAFLLRQFTTTAIDADRVHELGLREVARVHREMGEIMRRVGHVGDLRSFMEKLKSDPRFFLADDEAGRQQYLARANEIVGAMRARLPDVFLAAPPLPLELRATEAYRAAGAPSGFYESGTPDGRRPGVVYLNLDKLNTRPLYDLEWLLYHEALPGHHFQISSILVDPNIPRLRKVNRWWQDTAFVEGWGLYAERLGREMGFYQDPYSDFGRLSGELWRATRLVVDSGLHHKRWTRDVAIRYLDENTPSPRASNEQAVDRYLAVPGQATAFTVGMLQILDDRERAKLALGSRFDIREFHAALLQSGYLPLWAMSENVTRWIESRAPASAN
jgi:uncharacterized protein (DUF885 family)